MPVVTFALFIGVDYGMWIALAVSTNIIVL